MRKPLIVINLKTYQQGKDVLKLCRKIEEVDKNIIVGVSATDVYRVASETNLRVYVQHVDFMRKGRNTGFVLPEGVKGAGAVGVMLNHSEHPLSHEVLKKTIVRCRKLKLKTMVFARDLGEAREIERMKVDYIVVEPADLIAGKISVSEAQPDLIANVSHVLKSKFLVGAGVHSREDVRVAVKNGALGVALSSAVTTAKNPRKVLRELLGKEK